MKKLVYVIYLLLASFLWATEHTFVLDAIVVDSEQTAEYSIDEISYNQDFLQANKIESVDDLNGYVPSLSISNYGSRNVALVSYRGHTNFMTTQSPLALYIDDIPFSYGNTFLAHELFNISSVTMLKGPQGFETGLGAQAGIIDLRTDESVNKPLGVTFKVGLANYSERKAVLHVNIPLKEGAVKIDGLYQKRDGFTTNKYNNSSLDDEETKALNVKVIKNINSDYRVTLQALLNNNDDGGTPYQATPQNPFEMNQNINGYVRQNSNMAALKLEYFANNYHLKSLTALSDYRSIELLDADRTPENIIELRSKEHLKQISEELILSYDEDDYTLIGGVFFSNQYDATYEEQHDFNYLDVAGYRLWKTSQPEQNSALFATYKQRLNRSWQADFGLRYSITKKRYDNQFTEFFPIEIPDYGFVNGNDLSIEETKYWHRILPKVSLSYMTSSNSTLFFKYAKGFKSGGYSYDDYDVTTVSYEPEDSDAFELGYLSNPNDKLSFSASVYATLVDNLQVETVRPDLSSYIDNSAKAAIYGLEAQLNYVLSTQWSFQSALALTQAQFREYISNSIDYSGNSILNVPKYTFFMSSQYDFSEAYFLNASLKSQGKTYFDKANALSQDAYALVGMTLGYRSQNLSWNVYVKNAFDKRYFNHILHSDDEHAYNFGEPRRIGLELTYAFN